MSYLAITDCEDLIKKHPSMMLSLNFIYIERMCLLTKHSLYYNNDNSNFQNLSRKLWGRKGCLRTYFRGSSGSNYFHNSTKTLFDIFTLLLSLVLREFSQRLHETWYYRLKAEGMRHCLLAIHKRHFSKM